ncbi:unnamed protein product [Didymodactylos carnosus]|uniref:EGF-like domain-containing protein n=1 Tax=Didymodactylos carnosus TaxID=1234261 RepID=A0A814UGI3_9BILA|nr:unnamed protein product [Didymodactylos carnosus]CAF3938396.1 unnamed protein product [Didymodactylos carnosus]
MKLSLFEPFMNLSNQFRYVIEQMPCCADTYDQDELENYINDYVFNYFGFSYITTIILGGMAQQTLFLSKNDKTALENYGYNLRNEAKFELLRSVNHMDEDPSLNITEHDEFMESYVKNKDQSTLGGDASLIKSSLTDWSKSVELNPVVIKFNIKSILGLLTKQHFPDDILIQNKSILIENTLRKYIQQHSKLYCYNDCTSRIHGHCITTNYFGFGQCHCNQGYSGIDCSQEIRGLEGTLCINAPYSSAKPVNACQSENYRHIFTFSVPANPVHLHFQRFTNNLPGLAGTLCGLSNGYVAEILCEDRNPIDKACPTGYETFEWVHQYATLFTCMKMKNEQLDSRGTLCGFQFTSSSFTVSCDDHSPGSGSCPPHYRLKLLPSTFPFSSSCYKV